MHVLFVDSDQHRINGILAVLSSITLDWTIESVETAEKAFERLTRSPFDVVIADLNVGQAFLDDVARRYPDTVRILSAEGRSDERVLSGFSSAHQAISRPYDVGVLIETAERSIKLRRNLSSPAIRAVIHSMKDLPSPPQAFFELADLLRREDYRQSDLLVILERDPALTAAILRVANSAYFGGRGRISSIRAAVTLLGTNSVKYIVFFSGIFSGFERTTISGFSLDEYWRHSADVSHSALAIAKHFGLPGHVRDDAFAAGLLHDVGKLVFLRGMPNKFQEAILLSCESGAALHDAEAEIIGAEHNEVGAYLLQLWGLPHSIVEAVAFHHHSFESCCMKHTPLSLVCVANAHDHLRYSDDPYDPLALEKSVTEFLSEAERKLWAGVHRAFQE